VLSLTQPLNDFAQKGIVNDLMVGLNFSKKLLKAVLNFTVAVIHLSVVYDYVFYNKTLD
jgi:hypothetical protein